MVGTSKLKVISLVCTLLLASSCIAQTDNTKSSSDSSGAISVARDKHSKVATRNSGIALNAATARRNPATIDCDDLQGRNADKPIGGSEDSAAVYGLLQQINNESALRAFVALPDEFMWWIRTVGNVSMFSLGVAMHETTHVLSQVATRCATDTLQYYFNGKQWPVEKLIGKTENYSLAVSAIPEQFKSTSPMSRYQRLVVKSRNYSDNNLSVLLDELGAYTEAAIFEINLANTEFYTAQKLSGMTSMNANVGGTVEFMLFTLSYLRALKVTDPIEFAELKEQELFKAHLQRMWSSSEQMLCDARPFTVQNQGLFSVPSEMLHHIYNFGLVAILRELNIKYSEEEVCIRFYSHPITSSDVPAPVS